MRIGKIADASIKQKGRNDYELQKVSNLSYASCACTAGRNSVLLYDKREGYRRTKGWDARTGSYSGGKQDLRMSAGGTLYLKIGKNVVVTDRRVTQIGRAHV